jgi:hypothetical protein
MRGFEVKFMFTVAALALALIFFVSFVANASQILVSGCWKNALRELEPLSRPKSIGFGALLGRESIRLPVTMNAGCVDRVAFTDYEGCKELCREFPGDRNECYNVCNRCHEQEGCIVALPKTGGFMRGLKSFFTLGMSRESPASWISSYGFDGIVIKSEDHENKIVCLGLTLNDGLYSIVVEEVESAEECGVEE